MIAGAVSYISASPPNSSGLRPHTPSPLVESSTVLSTHFYRPNYSVFSITMNLGAWYPLVIAQYAVYDDGQQVTHRWALAALQSRRTAHVYQLRGDACRLSYDGPYLDHVYCASPTLRGGVHVGHMRDDHLAELDEFCMQVSLEADECTWDGQWWVMEVLRRVKARANPFVVVDTWGETQIRAELEREQRRWEGSDDLVEDRLFSS